MRAACLFFDGQSSKYSFDLFPKHDYFFRTSSNKKPFHWLNGRRCVKLHVTTIADPLTTSASIIALIQISSAVLSLFYQEATSAADSPKAINWVISEVGRLKVVLEELKALENTWSGPGPSFLGEGRNAGFQGPSEVVEANVPSGPSIGISGTEPSEATAFLDSVRKNPPALVDAGGSLSPSILMQSTDPAAALNTSDTKGAKQINPRFELRTTAASAGLDHSALLKCLSATHGPLKTCESALQTIHHEISTPRNVSL